MKGTVEYRFDAKTGYLTEVELEDMSLSMTADAGGTGSNIEIRFSGDVTARFSKFNEVDIKQVKVPSFVKDSATELQGDQGATGLLGSGSMYPGLVAAPMIP